MCELIKRKVWKQKWIIVFQRVFSGDEGSPSFLISRNKILYDIQISVFIVGNTHKQNLYIKVVFN